MGSILQLMTRERLRRKEFVPTLSDLRFAANTIVTRANSLPDPRFRNELLKLCGLSYGKEDFTVTEKSENFMENAIDIVMEENGEHRVAFSLGIGENALNFWNKLMFTDVYVYKTKPLSEIKGYFEFFKTIENFITNDPKDNEKIDVSQEAMERRRFSSQKRAERDLAAFRFSR